jgi:hypothetical protein
MIIGFLIMCSALINIVPPIAMFATFVDRCVKDRLCCHEQLFGRVMSCWGPHCRD